MKKEKSTINFRGKEMKILDARGYITKLKTEIIRAELNEEEKIGYSIFKKAHGEEATEKEYLIGTLEARIAIQGHLNKIEECREQVHKGEEVLMRDSFGKALCYCHTCESTYNRRMTPEEWRDFNKKMNEPFYSQIVN
ncbi:MAG: hypothetical protein ABIE36_02440 [Candidatus Diapherotrites archaeon]